MVWGMLRSRLWLAGLFAMAVALLLAPRADAAYLYWTNDAGKSTHPGTVGRANLDGTGATNTFITSPNGACGIAADANYLYWSVGGGPKGLVARANLLTGDVQTDFITTVNNLNCGIAANASSVFFNNYAIGAIARANLDGSGVNQTFVTGGSNPQMPAVSATHLYWVNKNAQSVGRAELGGGNVQQSFIPTKCAEPVGVAVDTTYVYWANTNCTSIGRAKLDGSEIDQDFVELSEEGACGLAVGGSHIYWGRYGEEGSGFVGRANLADGSGVNEKLIPTRGYTCGVAIGPDPAPPTPGPPAPSFKFVPPVKCTKGCKRILVKLDFASSGKIVVAQTKPKAKGKGKKAAKRPKLVKRMARSVPAGLLTLKLKPTKAGKEALAARGRLKAKLTFTFTPSAGAASTIVRTIKAKPPKPKKR